MNEAQLIQAIATRAAAMYERLSDVQISPAFIASELNIVHTYIIPLRLQELLDADDGNFAHDIGGIHRHLEIRKNQAYFRDGFSPRYGRATCT